MSIRLGSFVEAAAARFAADQISIPAPAPASTAPLKRRSTEAQLQRQAPRVFVPIAMRPAPQREATVAA